jgi:UDP-N-acetylmuramate dehydrogenase
MRSKKNVSLKPYNTFGIDVSAERFIVIKKDAEIVEFLSSDYAESPFYILGAGSNILLTKNIKGTVLKMETKGIDIVSIDKNRKVLIRAKAGENWDDFVRYCIKNLCHGLENLAAIPGKVGSCPIQNIGAYGEEVKNHIKRVYTISREDKTQRIFEKEECDFGYRSSIFKTVYKNQYIITDVEFELSIDGKLNVGYADIAQGIKALKKKPTADDVYRIVTEIRKKKLPDYKKWGNAGSFFKNPVVDIFHYETIKQQHLLLKAYPVSPETCKLSAAQLIELIGWKGKQIGKARVHNKQPLVLVNCGGATGGEVLSLAKKIQQDIFSLFGVKLELEVNVW